MFFNKVAQIVKRQRYAFNEVGLALENATITVGSEGLEYAQEDIVPEVIHEVWVTVERHVMLQEFDAYGVGKVTLGAEKQRRYVVLCCAAPTALVVDVIERG